MASMACPRTLHERFSITMTIEASYDTYCTVRVITVHVSSYILLQSYEVVSSRILDGGMPIYFSAWSTYIMEYRCLISPLSLSLQGQKKMTL